VRLCGHCRWPSAEPYQPKNPCRDMAAPHRQNPPRSSRESCARRGLMQAAPDQFGGDCRHYGPGPHLCDPARARSRRRGSAEACSSSMPTARGYWASGSRRRWRRHKIKKKKNKTHAPLRAGLRSLGFTLACRPAPILPSLRVRRRCSAASHRRHRPARPFLRVEAAPC